MSPFKKVLKDNETLVIEDVFNSTLCQILEGNKIKILFSITII